MTDLRLYTPEGASMDLDTLISALDRHAEKAKTSQEAMHRALRGSYFSNQEDFARATSEVAIQAGMEIAFRQSADLLRAVKERLVAEPAA